MTRRSLLWRASGDGGSSLESATIPVPAGYLSAPTAEEAMPPGTGRGNTTCKNSATPSKSRMELFTAASRQVAEIFVMVNVIVRQPLSGSSADDLFGALPVLSRCPVRAARDLP